MVEQSGSIAWVKPVPFQVVNEGASFGPLNLLDYLELQVPGSVVRFQAELSNGKPLPKGLICTTDGVISGIPAVDTHGFYEYVVTAMDKEGFIVTTRCALNISSRIALETDELFVNYKAKVWESLTHDLPLPDMQEILNRSISVVELYYLLQRCGILTIWDVYNLEPPQGKTVLQVDGMSEHYNIYDRGSCLVGAPKDLFSYDRTPEDALKTSRAMAREVYKRNWTIEISGFSKMMRGAWVELQHLGDKNGRYIDVMHYTPSPDDMRVYTKEATAFAASMGK